LLAYIWNTTGRLPSEIFNLPPLEKEFVYQATLLKIKEERKPTKKGG
jgi:hypothetical protein